MDTTEFKETRISATHLKDQIGKVINRAVADDGEVTILQRHGQDAAAVISIADYERLKGMGDAEEEMGEAADNSSQELEIIHQIPMPLDEKPIPPGGDLKEFMEEMKGWQALAEETKKSQIQDARPPQEKRKGFLSSFFGDAPSD